MKKVFVLAVFLFASWVSSFAQITVIDPASIRQQVQQLINMQRQLIELQKAYSLYQQAYALQQAEAQQLRALPTRYRYTFSNWQQFAASNTYSNTSLWAAGANNGNPGQILSGYRSLVSPVQPVAPSTPNAPQAAAEWKQQYGLMELRDATILAAVKTLGDVRTNNLQTAQALTRLEQDSTSSDPSLNSAKALQQKTLVAILLTLRNLQDTNRLLAASLDLQAQEAAQTRFEHGHHMNAGAAIRQSLGN